MIGGDGSDDYVRLDRDLSQLNYNPRRTVAGSQQRINVLGGIPGDMLVWRALPSDCSTAAGPVSSSKTSEYTFAAFSDTFILSETTGAGLFLLCHKVPGSTGFIEVSGIP